MRNQTGEAKINLDQKKENDTFSPGLLSVHTVIFNTEPKQVNSILISCLLYMTFILVFSDAFDWNIS